MLMNSKPPTNSFQNNHNTNAGPMAAVSNTGRCEPLLDSAEAAQLLRIHPKTLQRMARKGQVPAIQIGKLWRFSSSALLLWEQEKLAG
jgi:excisionase family DNA binding protein